MIKRSKHVENFTVIPNAIINDESLTMETGFLLVYLLSKSENWEVSQTHLAKHFRIGKDKMQSMIRLLIAAGYVAREQCQNENNRRFKSYNYTVYDIAFSSKQMEPQPENTAAENNSMISNGESEDINKTQEKAAAVFSVAGKSGHIERTDLTKTSSKENSAEAGANTPSETSMIWKEGRELLKQAASPANPSIIGKWLKQVPTSEGKSDLRAAIQAAVEAGSADPIAYVTAALAKTYPPLPSAKTFDLSKWSNIQRATIKTKAWSEAWGPAPGKKGCMMPSQFITSQLTASLLARRIAA